LHKNDVQSVAVSVSNLDYTGLIIVDPRVEINEICYCFISATMGAAWHYVKSLARSETEPQCTDHASFLTLIFREVVRYIDAFKPVVGSLWLYCKFPSEYASERTIKIDQYW